MNLNNQMQEKILSAFRSAADERVLDWVEIRTSACEGTARLQPPGRFKTLLKLEYEFEPHVCRLLVEREGKTVAGRCGIRYDDGAEIEHVLTAFRKLLPDVDRPLPRRPLNDRGDDAGGWRPVHMAIAAKA